MQVSILQGIYTDGGPDALSSYPVNWIPVSKNTGVSNAYLRPGDGLISKGTGPGLDRGGINWRGSHYRVMGTKLVRITAGDIVEELGDVGPGAQVVFDYSFDRLAINSGTRLYYWNGTLTQVTDPDLGQALDVVWVDGYFMTTDGTSLVVTDLNDPLSVNPLKYGSSEADPDPVVALMKVRNEIYAVNRHTIEVFDNVGGEFFPFQRVEGAQIQKGAVGRDACCVFIDAIAFLGGWKNEAPAIYLGANATTQKLSTDTIDKLLAGYTEEQLSAVLFEARNDESHRHLYVHLPDRTLVYDALASEELQGPVWCVLTSTLDGFGTYRARNFIWVHGKWYCGDPSTANFGVTDLKTSHHWGQIVRNEFYTALLYNEGKGAILNRVELVGLTGRVQLGTNPVMTTSYSLDGQTWSQPFPIQIGGQGEAIKRMAWFRQGYMRNFRTQRFSGDSQAHVSILRLEADAEALAY